MNRTIKDATVKRYHDDSHHQLRRHLQDFIDADLSGASSNRRKGLPGTNTSANAGPQSRSDSSAIRSVKCRD